MERAAWLVDPEVLLLGQVLGIAVFVIALALALASRVQQAGYRWALNAR